MAPIVGPPKIHSSHSTGDPFIDLMSAHFNNPDLATTWPPMRRTKNQSPTFLFTGDPCLDFFFHVLPDSPSETIHRLLKSAWVRDPLTALKLICHLRGTGKSDKESFYTAALWIHHQHPKTLALNIDHIARFGYLKDMPEILFRLHHGNDVRKTAKSERLRYKRRHPRRSNMKKKKKSSKAKSLGQKSIIQKMLSVPPPPIGNAPEVARELRKKKEAEQAKRAMERYNRDPNYQFLHDQISECFAQLLRSDLASLKLGEMGRIGLAAKWCPSLDSSYDRHTLLCESIARRVFPQDSDPDYAGLEEAHYAYRIRDRLRKEVLVPLRPRSTCRRST